MINPTKAQVQIIIDNFTKVLPASKKLDESKGCSVDMGNGLINKNNPCGTLICHGGWYAVACFPKAELKEKHLNFYDGAHLMAQHLGFYNKEELVRWAKNNPITWGNENGFRMFDLTIVFNYTGNLTLTKIVKHWKQVQKRLPK